MDYNKERYPGLYRLRDALKSRPKTKLPSPVIEGDTSLMDNIPMRAQPSRKVSAIKPSMISDMETVSQNAKARESLGGWGEKKFAGGMTTDQFVSLAGALSHAIAPKTPMGRVGSVMSRLGTISEERRLGKKEKLRLEDVEKRKLLTKSLLDIGKEERTRGFTKGTALTLAEAKKAEADREYELELDRIAESKRRFGITEARLGKERPKALTQWVSYYTAQKKLGKSDTEIVESFKKLGKELKTPSPVTWTTASKNVSSRFGKQDALGNIIITPGLQGKHGIAQRKLVELQKTGEYKPLDAVNISEDFARNIENRCWEYLDAAERDKDLTMKVKNQFRKKYGYVPKRRTR